MYTTRGQGRYEPVTPWEEQNSSLVYALFGLGV